MDTAPRTGRPRRGGRWSRTLARALVVALLAPLCVMVPAATPALAAISQPAADSTVGGIVDIREARGGTNGFLCSGASSRIRVDRVEADGSQTEVFAQSHGSGAWTTQWDSIGEPNGLYRIRSWTRDTSRSFFSCSTGSEVLRSNITVTLENRAVAQIELPSTAVTGEPLPVQVTTRETTTDRAVGDLDVSISVPGVGDAVVTTGDDGRGATTVALPDLPAGSLPVEATVAGDERFVGESSTASTTLERRTTTTSWEGDVRGDPGTTARLAGQLIDTTPDSDRFGDPVPGVDLALALGDSTGTATTSSSGRAVRTTTVEGPTRLETAVAEFAGDDVWAPSSDDITFYVGDEASLPAPEEHGQVGGTTRLLDSILGSIIDETTAVVETLTSAELLDRLLGDTPLESDHLHLLPADELSALLDDLLGELDAGRIGDPVDDVLDQLLDQVAETGPLGELVDTVRFDWRSVHVDEDGQRTAREFPAYMFVPEPLDVTGDGSPDVLAKFSLVPEFGSLDVGPGSIDASIDGFTAVPRLDVARLPGAPDDLPISLEAIVSLPEATDHYRIGYDARDSDAPAAFRADLSLTDGGAGMDLATRGADDLTVVGAIVPTADGDLDPGAAAGGPEQRFAVSFDPAPKSARIALDLGGEGQDMAATLDTERPTDVGVRFIDDSGAGDLTLVNGAIEPVDGRFGIGVSGAVDGAIGVELTSDRGPDWLEVTATELSEGRIEQDLRLAMQDVPQNVAVGLQPDGTAGLTASDPIGLLEVGFAAGGAIATLEDPAYLHLLDSGDHTSVAAKLPGVSQLDMAAGDTVALGISMASTPLRALVSQDGLSLDAHIVDAPAHLQLAMSADGTVSIDASDPIQLVTVEASDPDGIVAAATSLELRLEDVPSHLSIALEGEEVVFDAGGDAIGLVEIAGTSGPELVLPDEGDGLLMVMDEDDFAIAGRISGLRRIAATLGDAPDLHLDTVAGEVFTIELLAGDDPIVAVIDHLVPDMRIRLQDDGSGALGLEYRASAATNSISFDLGGMSASISDPLPAELDICFAADEACLPDLGIDDPGIGSIHFRASEMTTLDLSDPAGGMSASGLRLQLLELTGDLDMDDGGDLYLNTTEFGGVCGEIGCVRTIDGGSVVAAMDDIAVTFRPGAGFYAINGLVGLEVTTFLGIPTGVNQVSHDGTIRCVSDTRLEATAFGITLNLTDGICDNSTNEPPPPSPDAPVDPDELALNGLE